MNPPSDLGGPSRFAIRFVLQAPLMTRSTTEGSLGVDAFFLRSTDGARLEISAELVKGRFRAALLELLGAGADLSESEDLLGPSSENGGSWEPRRARLRFKPFYSPLPQNRENKRSWRVAIDERTGAARERMLCESEMLWDPGQEVVFAGEAWLYPGKDPAKDRRTLEAGLSWIEALGSSSSVGLGKVESVQISPLEAPRHSAAARPLAAERIAYRLRFLSPFCIAEPRTADNVFRSDDIVPGAVLKACLARALKPSEAFDRLLVSHAFPQRKPLDGQPAARPRTLPWSLARWKDEATKEEKFGDLAGALPNFDKDDRLLRFQLDWKDDALTEKIRREHGWAQRPDRRVRVRTAIDAKTRRAAEAQLFSLEEVIPFGYVWLGWIDLSGILKEEQRAELRASLAALHGRSFGDVGRSKATFVLELYDQASPAPRQTLQPNDLVALTLQTPALLGDPRIATEDAPRDASPVGWCDPSLFKAYAADWENKSGGCLKLAYYFARQTLHGGNYLKNRFQPGRPYNPWLLSEAGSVFVLEPQKGSEAAAEELLIEWRRHGLPLAAWTQDAYGLSLDPREDWRRCPYLPENGYGEIEFRKIERTAP